eukprot:scaffold368_cov258-Pinguiococcus_pyrenoidosus.AAC.61
MEAACSRRGARGAARGRPQCYGMETLLGPKLSPWLRYIHGAQPTNIRDRFPVSVASLISLSTCPGTDRGTRSAESEGTMEKEGKDEDCSWLSSKHDTSRLDQWRSFLPLSSACELEPGPCALVDNPQSAGRIALKAAGVHERRLFCDLALRSALSLPGHSWIAQEGLQHVQQSLAVISQNAQDNAHDVAEDAGCAEEAHGVHHVRGEAERDDLRHLQMQALVEDAIEIHVHQLRGIQADQNVLAVPVPKACRTSSERGCQGGARLEAYLYSGLPQTTAPPLWCISFSLLANGRARGTDPGTTCATRGETSGRCPFGRHATGPSRRGNACSAASQRLASSPRRAARGSSAAICTPPRSGFGGSPYDGIRAQPELALCGLSVLVQQPVHHNAPLHQPRVLAKVALLLSLAQELHQHPIVRLAVDLLRLRLRPHDIHFRQETPDPGSVVQEGLVYRVRTASSGLRGELDAESGLRWHDEVLQANAGPDRGNCWSRAGLARAACTPRPCSSAGVQRPGQCGFPALSARHAPSSPRRRWSISLGGCAPSES